MSRSSFHVTWDTPETQGLTLTQASVCFYPQLFSSAWVRVSLKWSSSLQEDDRLVGLVVRASVSRAAEPWFELRFVREDFCGPGHTSDLKDWHSSGYPARRLALSVQHWDWSAWCQYTVTCWDRKCDLQLLSPCGSTYNCLRRSVPEIHLLVAWDVN